VPELFAAQVMRVPDAVAVACDGVSLSYTELNARAGRLARLLSARGAGPETVVAVAMERSAELVIALLGVLKAGAAYLPVDPAYPAERIAFMLVDASPALIITSTAAAPSLPGPVTVPVLVAGESGTGAQPAVMDDADPGHGERRVPLRSRHPAYVIYTSGSTGRPKGVTVPHNSMVNHMAWMQGTYRLAGSDRVLQKAPFSFDASVWEIFWPLLEGAMLVLARPGGHQDPADPPGAGHGRPIRSVDA
jgi:non-ribosomal peptide synthetase component F